MNVHPGKVAPHVVTQMLIGGVFVGSVDGRTIDVENPGTRSSIAAVPRAGAEDVTGNLTITTVGGKPVIRGFALGLLVGSARWHGGYGTVNVVSTDQKGL